MTPDPAAPTPDPRVWFRTHPVRLAEVPVGHEVSLPLPTRRTGEPAFAAFAAPARRLPGRPAEVGAPDRWWVLDPAGRLLVYALVRAVPFGAVPVSPVVVPPPPRGLDEQRALVDRLAADVLAASAAFFADGAAGAAGAAVRAGLAAAVPDGLRPAYAALVPDFFAWLGR